MSKQILLPVSVKAEIVRTFKTDRSTLHRALNYSIDSPTARMLRAAALERGGLIYRGHRAPAGSRPDVETSFDRSRNVLRQAFGRRMSVEVDLNTNRAVLFVDSQDVAHFEQVTANDWGDVLYSLQQLYNRLGDSGRN